MSSWSSVKTPQGDDEGPIAGYKDSLAGHKGSTGGFRYNKLMKDEDRLYCGIWLPSGPSSSCSPPPQ
jgi:hypothetical protein